MSLSHSKQKMQFLSSRSSESKTASGVVHPLVLEVHPLMESGQNELLKTERNLIPEKSWAPVEDFSKVASSSVVANSLAISNVIRRAQSVNSISSEGETAS